MRTPRDIERAAHDLVEALATVPSATQAKFRVLFSEMQRLKDENAALRFAAVTNGATVRALQSDRDHWQGQVATLAHRGRK